MLRILTAWSVFTGFTTAPVNLATIIASMGTTTPLEVIFLDVVFATILADLLQNIQLALLLFELLHSFTHFFSLLQQILLLSFELHLHLKAFICFLSLSLQVPVEFKQLFLESFEGQCFFSFNLVFLRYEILSVLAIDIPLLKRFLNFSGQHHVLLILIQNVVLLNGDLNIKLVLEILGV